MPFENRGKSHALVYFLSICTLLQEDQQLVKHDLLETKKMLIISDQVILPNVF